MPNEAMPHIPNARIFEPCLLYYSTTYLTPGAVFSGTMKEDGLHDFYFCFQRANLVSSRLQDASVYCLFCRAMYRFSRITRAIPTWAAVGPLPTQLRLIIRTLRHTVPASGCRGWRARQISSWTTSLLLIRNWILKCISCK